MAIGTPGSNVLVMGTGQHAKDSLGCAAGHCLFKIGTRSAVSRRYFRWRIRLDEKQPKVPSGTERCLYLSPVWRALTLRIKGFHEAKKGGKNAEKGGKN
jgi:hypothetical protein